MAGTILLGSLAFSPLMGETPESALVAEGDAHYARRHEGHVRDRADSREILEAIASYEKAAVLADAAQARWKLARALYFRGEYTGLEAAARRAVFEQARTVSEEAIAILARAAGGARTPEKIAEKLRGNPDAPPVFFWAAVAWGQWGLAVGKLTAAKSGAASRVRDDARVLIALDPEFEEGGGYRILGRLHDQAPRIPLVTWWVSRDEAIANLRRAAAVSGNNLVNLHFLAEALARDDVSGRAQARRIEQKVVDSTPSPDHMVEEIHIQEEARRNLSEWRQ